MTTFNENDHPRSTTGDGTFARKDFKAADGIVLAPAASAADLTAMDTARTERMQRWSDLMDNAPDSEEFAAIDREHQHASVQCAAAVLLSECPTAATLTIRENEDGENQYDIVGAADADGNAVYPRGFNEDSGWSVMYGNDAMLDETLWAVNTRDDTWAEGIATITNSRYDGKTAVIDLKAALTAPVPSGL